MKVAAETGQNVNSQWFHKTPSKRKTLNPVFTERNVCRWRDVHLPFESLALRVRLFDEDTMDDDDPLGEIFVRVADLDLEDPDCPYRRFLPGGRGSTRVGSGPARLFFASNPKTRAGSGQPKKTNPKRRAGSGQPKKTSPKRRAGSGQPKSEAKPGRVGLGSG